MSVPHLESPSDVGGAGKLLLVPSAGGEDPSDELPHGDSVIAERVVHFRYVYLYCVGYATSWPSCVKGSAPNASFDDGNRAAALWLDR